MGNIEAIHQLIRAERTITNVGKENNEILCFYLETFLRISLRKADAWEG